MAETDLIRRSEAIDVIENTDWYHQDTNNEMALGANPDTHQAWYKAEDVYNALESVPSAQPEQDIDELLTPDEIAELVKKQPIAYRDIYEDGYTKALRDFTDIARNDLYHPLTFYDEGVNAGIRRAINTADYLMQEIQREGVKNDE